MVYPKILSLFKRVDVIVTPEPVLAPEVGAEKIILDGVEEDVLSVLTRYTAPGPSRWFELEARCRIGCTKRLGNSGCFASNRRLSQVP